jgi:hypothetical protein
MNNRWSPAARLAALAVRRARAKGVQAAKGVLPVTKKNLNGVVPSLIPKNQGILPTTKKDFNGVVPSLTPQDQGILPVTKKNLNGVVPSLIPKTPAKNVWLPPPNDPHWNDPAFVESFKKGVAERKKPSTAAQGIRYDPKNPDHPKSPMPPKTGGGGSEIPRGDVVRVKIGGKWYTKVGNKYSADVASSGGKEKVFYQK